MSVTENGNIIVPDQQGQQPDPPSAQLPPLTVPGAQQQGRLFTEEEIQRARTQEREKLYQEREQERQELARLKAEVEERKRRDEEAKAQADATAAEERRRQESEEMSAKELIAARESELRAEMERRDEQWRSELQQRDALLAKEREFAELKDYISQVVAANADNILPELVDFVTGNSKAEIDAATQRVVERSASVLNNFRQVGVEQRRAAPGVSANAPAIGPESNVAGQRTFTPEEIANWTMAEYQQYRDQLGPGRAGAHDRGLF